MLQLGSLLEELAREGDVGELLITRLVDDRNLILQLGRAVVFLPAFLDAHRAFHLEHLRQELTEEEHHEPDMGQEDTRLLRGELEAGDVGRNEVDEEGPAEKVAARKDRHLESISDFLEDEEAPEIQGLRIP